MRTRLSLIAAAVVFAVLFGIWLLRDDGQKVSLSMSVSPENEASQFPTAQRSPVSPLTTTTLSESVHSFVEPVMPSNSADFALKGALSAASESVDVPTNTVDPVILKRVEEERVQVVDLRSTGVLVALKLYKQVFGVYPSGNSRDVSVALTGENPNRIVFIEGQGWTNTQRELLDPWGKPYVFRFDSSSVTVRSSGPNKVLGDTDDIIRVKGH